MSENISSLALPPLKAYVQIYIWFVLLDNSPLTAVVFNFIQQSKNFMVGAVPFTITIVNGTPLSLSALTQAY